MQACKCVFVCPAIHASVVGRLFGAVGVTVAPKHFLSWGCGSAAAFLSPSLWSSFPPILQQHRIQHVRCQRDGQKVGLAPGQPGTSGHSYGSSKVSEIKVKYTSFRKVKDGINQHLCLFIKGLLNKICKNASGFCLPWHCYHGNAILGKWEYMLLKEVLLFWTRLNIAVWSLEAQLLTIDMSLCCLCECTLQVQMHSTVWVSVV